MELGLAGSGPRYLERPRPRDCDYDYGYDVAKKDKWAASWQSQKLTTRCEAADPRVGEEMMEWDRAAASLAAASNRSSHWQRLPPSTMSETLSQECRPRQYRRIGEVASKQERAMLNELTASSAGR